MPATTSIPKPEAIVPSFAELPHTIKAAIEALSKPFPPEEVKVRPGPVKRDGTAALCLPYSEWWTGYLPRLNDEIGPNNWSIDLEPWGTDQIIARMTAFGGLIRKASSGSAKGEANGAAEAEAQAKKRVCAESMMLGLFFYFLPNVWAKGEKLGKDFYFAEGEEQRAVYEMYRRAGLTITRSPGITIAHDDRPDRPTAPKPTQPPAAPTHHAQPAVPANDRATTAAAALRSAERRAGVAPASVGAKWQPASEAQLNLIATLTNRLITQHRVAASVIDAAGDCFTISTLSTQRTMPALRDAATQLGRLDASKLIDRLKALEPPAAHTA
jgi:hypothetical protein